MLLERGIDATYETIRKWCQVRDYVYARFIRLKKGFFFNKKWHYDEVRLKVKGEIFWLRRLIDSDGEKIEILLQKSCNVIAAIHFSKQL